MFNVLTETYDTLVYETRKEIRKARRQRGRQGTGCRHRSGRRRCPFTRGAGARRRGAARALRPDPHMSPWAAPARTCPARGSRCTPRTGWRPRVPGVWPAPQLLSRARHSWCGSVSGARGGGGRLHLSQASRACAPGWWGPRRPDVADVMLANNGLRTRVFGRARIFGRANWGQQVPRGDP